MLDVSIARAKQREKTAEVDTSLGPAGVILTRKEPGLLATSQAKLLDEFLLGCVQGKHERAALRENVMMRLSGTPAKGAFDAALYVSGHEAGIPEKMMREFGVSRPHEHNLKCIPAAMEIKET